MKTDDLNPSKATKSLRNESDRDLLFYHFWEEFVEDFYQDDPKVTQDKFKIRKPSNRYDLNIDVGVLPIYIELVILEEKLQARIYFKDSQKVFDRLMTEEEAIDKCLGERAQFISKPSGISKIILEHEFDLNDKREWKDGIKWLKSSVLRLNQVVDTFIR